MIRLDFTCLVVGLVSLVRAELETFIVKLNPAYDAARFLLPIEDQRPSSEKTLHIFHHEFFNGFVLSADSDPEGETLSYLARKEEEGVVEYTAKDGTLVFLTVQQTGASRALERLSSKKVKLDGNDHVYTYDETAGAGVDVYVVDSGIFAGHDEFGTTKKGLTREARIKCAYSASQDDCDDPHGHGTAMASLVGGRTVGVAKEVNLHIVKILSRDGLAWYSEVMKALEFVWSDTTGPNPAVVLMSWGFMGGEVAPLDENMQRFIDVDVHVVAAAGNGEHDASKISPHHDDLIKVGALDELNDSPTSWSATGPEVLFWAPGENIEAAAIGSKHKYRVASGTSLSAAYVAGVAAVHLGKYGQKTQQEVIIDMEVNSMMLKMRYVPQVPQ